MVPSKVVLTEEMSRTYAVGPGDETIMIGRLIAHDGRVRNSPSVRFGNISMMPDEPFRHDGRIQRSFIVESRSIPGYSGSPVFVHIPSDSWRPGPDGKLGQAGVLYGEAPVLLLGIDCGHVHKNVPVKDAHGKDTEYRVLENTGMMVVVPAWRLWDVINSREFLAQRAAIDQSRLETGTKQ